MTGLGIWGDTQNTAQIESKASCMDNKLLFQRIKWLIHLLAVEKSTGEKILLPNLFKQAMVKFSFLVTNLTSRESDSSLAEMWAEKCSFLEAPKSQVHFGKALDVL